MRISCRSYFHHLVKVNSWELRYISLHQTRQTHDIYVCFYQWGLSIVIVSAAWVTPLGSGADMGKLIWQKYAESLALEITEAIPIETWSHKQIDIVNLWLGYSLCDITHHEFWCDVIDHPCPNVNDGFDKLPGKVSHRWVITYHNYDDRMDS